MNLPLISFGELFLTWCYFKVIDNRQGNFMAKRSILIFMIIQTTSEYYPQNNVHKLYVGLMVFDHLIKTDNDHKQLW